MRRPMRGNVVALVAWGMLHLSASGVSAQGTDHALDVPYVVQSEALCGGAASAMVLRYWGARGVDAEQFIGALNGRRDGIETGALVDAIVDRGWRALAFTGTMGSVRHHLGRGRPVITLIAVRPARLHYVVVVEVNENWVVYHDPAGKPFQRSALTEFERAWSGSSRWSLLVLPGESSSRTTVHVAQPAPANPGACQVPLQLAAEAAARRDLGDAERLLGAAQIACPTAAAPLRELAGLRLLQQRSADAVPLAQEAVRRDPADRHAWQVLGTAQFLQRNQAEALRAWNEAGEPLNDLVRVDGLTRTRYRVVTDRLGVATGDILTPARLERAQRRLTELPAGSASRVEVAPVGGGLAEVRAAVLERPSMPTSRQAFAVLGVRTLTTREATWRVSSPTGGGERLDLFARWWEARPAVGAALMVPLGARRLGGILRLEGAFARESFQTTTTSDVPLIEDRRSAAVSLSDWATADLRWDVTARLDRWSDRPMALGLGGALEHRLGDAAAIRLRGDVWPAGGFGSASLGARWRWPADGVDRLLTSATVAVAGRDAPRALWSGAGTGHARQLLLRAHPLLDDGVVTGDAFGRRLVQASAEWRHGLAAFGPLRLQLAAFTDAAIASRGDQPRAAHVDAGLGLRVRVPGEGTLRLDVARGLDDGRQAMSVGWELPWPAWP